MPKMGRPVVRHSTFKNIHHPNRMMIKPSPELDLEKLGNHSKAPKESPIFSKIALEKTGSIGAS